MVSIAERLKKEIKQQKPFESVEQEIFLNLHRTTEALTQGLAEVLKPAGLPLSQYNVLRILRGAGSEGLACQEVAERMVTRDPDITRLLDRLERRGLVSRSRDHKDRRVIRTRITEEGLCILHELDEPVAALHVRQLAHLGEDRLRLLVELLETAREKAT